VLEVDDDLGDLRKVIHRQERLADVLRDVMDEEVVERLLGQVVKEDDCKRVSVLIMR
jgi:hypothetical protein